MRLNRSDSIDLSKKLMIEIDNLDKAYKRSKKALRQQAKAIKRLKAQIEDLEEKLIIIERSTDITNETLAIVTMERNDLEQKLKDLQALKG